MAEEIKDTDHGKTLATWTFPEFKKYEFTTGWYIATSIIVAALAIWSIFDQNYLLLIIILLFVSILYIRNRREPSMLHIKITEDGIDINTRTFYEWKDIKKFWIIYEPPDIKNLYLEFKVGLRPSVTISLENQNPLEIRQILLEYLTEDVDKENESVSDGVSRLMKL